MAALRSHRTIAARRRLQQAAFIPANRSACKLNTPAPRPAKRPELPFDRAALIALLARGCVDLGLALETNRQERLIDYLAELHKHNQLHNLTAIREPEQMVAKHLLDALSVLPFARCERLVDVGSGGGIPGLPLLLAGACESLLLIDSVGKKARVMQEIVDSLGLSAQVEVAHARCESVDGRRGGSKVIARAFGSLAEFARFAGHLVAPSGALLAMKGKSPESELAQLPRPWVLAEQHLLQVPQVEGERCLIVLRRG